MLNYGYALSHCLLLCELMSPKDEAINSFEQTDWETKPGSLTQLL